MIVPRKIDGDCREGLKQVAEKSVHCCITSIPYWGLRSYLPKGHPLKALEIGTEKTFELYLEHVLESFRAVHRVLRDDGTIWVNIGDAYASNGGHADKNCNDRRGQYQIGRRPEHEQRDLRASGPSWKSKDLMMMPARVAMALQAEGWYLRAMCPWIKRNPMPESCIDRPATATEYVFMLSKSPRYFYDRYAVMMKTSDKTHPRRAHNGHFTSNDIFDKTIKGQTPKSRSSPKGSKNNESFAAECSQYVVGQRNRRNTDWFIESWQGMITDDNGDPLAFVVNPKGTTISHFATFPPKLIEPMIKASTSERGCCSDCGAPWERLLQPTERYQSILGKSYHPHLDDETLGMRGCRGGNAQNKMRDAGIPGAEFESKGWQPTCECHGTLTRGKIVLPARMSKEEVSNWGADSNGEYHGQNQKMYQEHLAQPASTVKQRIIENATKDREVDGWIYTSTLPMEEHPVVPCTVLDHFGGISTTAMVATQLGRRSIVCELNPEYAELAKARDSQTAMSLL